MESVSSTNTCALSQLSPGNNCKIVRIGAKSNVRRRILDMGLVPGVEVAVKGVAPLGDPMEVMIRGYRLSLRKQEAADIWVEVI